MYDLSIKLKPHLPEYEVNTHIVRAKFALYEICFSKLIDYVGTVDSRIGHVLEGLNDNHAFIFKDMSSNFYFSFHFFEIIFL